MVKIVFPEKVPKKKPYFKITINEYQLRKDRSVRETKETIQKSGGCNIKVFDLNDHSPESLRDVVIKAIVNLEHDKEA